jgi:hypothetical protein
MSSHCDVVDVMSFVNVSINSKDPGQPKGHYGGSVVATTPEPDYIILILS